MVQTNFLRNKLTTLSPDFSVFELFRKISMNLLADTLNGASISVIGKNDGVKPIGLHIGFFSVNSYEIKLFPYFLE